MKAALSGKARRSIFLCVLFPQRLREAEFIELRSVFPELILLVSAVDEEPPGHHDVLYQIKCIREFFNPDKQPS
ncbi:MAG: hypothetical protein O3A00_17880 [Planctomycetota bacterium]|nr:hypothetical protein [Planctomycetota bacterium]